MEQIKQGLGIPDLLADKRADILAIATRYGAVNVRVFGSVARGEATDDSDIDLMVDLQRKWTLWDRIGIKQDLEDLLGREVDVVVADSLRDIIRDHALSEVMPL